MKIHRIVQMLGATTTSGKLASDMYDLNYKTYYSHEEQRDLPISHMDFQHLIRAFVKQNEKDNKTDTLEDIIEEKDEIIDKLSESELRWKESIS